MGASISLIPGIDAVNLASNRISDRAAGDVISHLQVASALGGLDFSNNKLNLHAAKSLSNLIAITKTLVDVNLEHNRLGSGAVVVLCDGTKATSRHHSRLRQHGISAQEKPNRDATQLV
ncbi:unnamed protein product [Aphanomyces euteiches]